MPLRNWQEMLDEAEKSGPLEFKALDPGDYDLHIEKVEHRLSSKNKDGYNITAVVESGPYQNRKVFNTFWISPESPAAMGIFFRQMGVLGLDKDFWNANPSDEQICAALTGKRFIGTLKKSEYNGKERNEISGVATPRPAPAGGGPIQPGGGPVVPTPAIPTPQVATPPAQPVNPATTAAAAAPQPWAPQAPTAPEAAAPASPWDASAAPAAPAADDPWGATPPPVPPVPGA